MVSPAPDPLRIVTAYRDQAAAIRARVISYIQHTWGSLDSYRDADIDRFVGAVVPVVTAGQVRVAALTDAYLATFQAAVLGGPVSPIGIPADLVTDETLRGVPATDVYARTGPAVWTALANGSDIAAAAAIGLERASAMAATDLQLAKTHASRLVLAGNDNVVGYRRVLEGRKSCGLCVVASTQRYHRGDLMPIHPHCDCGVQPIFGDRDPGRLIEPVSSGDVEPVVHEHGELGPVLAVKGQTFTGPSDL